MIKLVLQSSDGDAEIEFVPTTLAIAGWTGRDTAALEEHIRELEAMGIARPRTVPIFYRVAATQLTSAPVAQVVGREASGEVEAVLFRHERRLYVGLGSDHTDRKLEAVGITLSKQLCTKPVGSAVWAWEEVKDHWDDLILRSTIESGVVYQEGRTAALRRPDELLACYEADFGTLPNGGVLFCGTLPARGGIRFSETMDLELIDPVAKRTLRHRYRVEVLPIAEDIA